MSHLIRRRPAARTIILRLFGHPFDDVSCLRNITAIACENTPEDLLEIWMFGGIDDGIYARVTEDNGGGVRDERIAIVIEKTHAVRSEADEKRADDIEKVFGDFNLSA